MSIKINLSLTKFININIYVCINGKYFERNYEKLITQRPWLSLL